MAPSVWLACEGFDEHLGTEMSDVDERVSASVLRKFLHHRQCPLVRVDLGANSVVNTNQGHVRSWELVGSFFFA
jgi:hypothetical protein